MQKYKSNINVMPAYKLTATRQMGKIPKGFVLQVASNSIPKPDAKDVENAIIRAGFDDNNSRSYKSAGNWTVEKLG
ncbi:hypothetical protein [Porphyromonas pogonae]|uniref:hypothetical protein n=1 Tax=Porphyromonas pogonae TaxID=867595 RepID=UPI002E76DE91|nr:hypothetical protein [Porphyromonas pogonae]